MLESALPFTSLNLAGQNRAAGHSDNYYPFCLIETSLLPPCYYVIVIYYIVSGITTLLPVMIVIMSLTYYCI